VHKLVVAFRRAPSPRSEDRLQMHVPGGGQDRVLRVTQFEVRGPFNATRREPDGRAASTSSTCYPTNAAEERPCAEKVIVDTSRAARSAARWATRT
jgi:hypothetical protein